MDFQTATEITTSIMKRAKQGVFGYTLITDEWYRAYQTWWKERHHFEIHQDWLVFCTGVVPAISSIVRKVTTVGENVVVMTPVHNILCVKHHVLVLSDEIHCDLTKPGWEYTPFASVSENCRRISITCVAPTKAFNLAGIQTAAVIVPDDHLRHKVTRGLNTDEVAEPNIFAAIAPIAAFTSGGEWLDALRKYLWKNRTFAEEYIKREMKGISPVSAKATYLLWLDCRNVIGSSTQLCRFIRSHSGLYLSDGNEYRGGEEFLRMNLACPRQQMEEGLKRLKESLETYESDTYNRRKS